MCTDVPQGRVGCGGQTTGSRGGRKKAAWHDVGGLLGFAGYVSGDDPARMRGGGGMFYDTHLQGDHNNGGVNAPPWSIRVNVTEPPGPFSDPYRGRDDFNELKHDRSEERRVGKECRARWAPAGTKRNAGDSRIIIT